MIEQRGQYIRCSIKPNTRGFSSLVSFCFHQTSDSSWSKWHSDDGKLWDIWIYFHGPLHGPSFFKSAGLDDIVVTRQIQPIVGVPAKIAAGHPTAEHQCLRLLWSFGSWRREGKVEYDGLYLVMGIDYSVINSTQ